MGDFHTYSPDLVTISFAGLIITGFANDTFVEVERDEAMFTKYTGALGDVARSRSLNKGGKVTITLMAVAPINNDLTGIALLDEVDGDAYAPLMIKDNNGSMVCHADIAWISKMPKIDRAKESGTIQWEFDCAAIDIEPNGNAALATIVITP